MTKKWLASNFIILGLLVGTLFLNPLLGVVVGAASGAITGALADIGIDDPMMKKMGESLQEGSAILFVLIKEMNFERFVKEVEGTGGLLIKTSLKHDDSAVLQRALDAHKMGDQQAASADEPLPEEVILHP